MNSQNLPQVVTPSTQNGGKNYEGYLPQGLKEMYEEQMRDSNPNDLGADIARLRASSNLLSENIQKKLDAVKDGGEPVSFDELNGYLVQLAGISEAIRRMVESQSRVNPENLAMFCSTVRDCVPDLETRERVVRRLQEIYHHSMEEGPVKQRLKLQASGQWGQV